MMGGMMGGAGGGRGPSPKTQLAGLVTKLDQLTTKPLEVKLTDDQRAKLRAQLQGLDEKEELSDDEAKKRLDEILKIVEGDKDTLEAAGYRWPGEGGGRGGGGGGGGGRQPPPPNPFKEGDAAKHLKDLENTVKAKKP
jgi:hypothetical protein